VAHPLQQTLALKNTPASQDSQPAPAQLLLCPITWVHPNGGCLSCHPMMHISSPLGACTPFIPSYYPRQAIEQVGTPGCREVCLCWMQLCWIFSYSSTEI